MVKDYEYGEDHGLIRFIGLNAGHVYTSIGFISSTCVCIRFLVGEVRLMPRRHVANLL